MKNQPIVVIDFKKVKDLKGVPMIYIKTIDQAIAIHYDNPVVLEEIRKALLSSLAQVENLKGQLYCKNIPAERPTPRYDAF